VRPGNRPLTTSPTSEVVCFRFWEGIDLLPDGRRERASIRLDVLKGGNQTEIVLDLRGECE
jgi:hypothetical protein